MSAGAETQSVSKAFVSVVTALGDDELIIGHRHSEWTGFAPHIEEDVAFSSIAQDEIGHAAAYYSLIARLTEDDADRIALGRSRAEYRHAIVCEMANGDWARTLARHWLYDHADAIRLESLEDSSNKGLAQLVAKIRREERYHLIHADTWISRVAHGPVEGRSKLTHAVTEMFWSAAALFEPFEDEDLAGAEDLLPVTSPKLQERFVAQTTATLDELGMPASVIRTGADETAEFVASSSGDLIASGNDSDSGASAAASGGGRKGRHTSDFESLWDDLTYTYRNNPGATW